MGKQSRNRKAKKVLKALKNAKPVDGEALLRDGIRFDFTDMGEAIVASKGFLPYPKKSFGGVSLNQSKLGVWLDAHPQADDTDPHD